MKQQPTRMKAAEQVRNDPSAQGAQPSPLGRYADTTEQAPELHEVRLLCVPVQVFIAARRHHDELLHELSMLALSDDERSTALPQQLLALVDGLGRRYGRSTDRPDAAIDRAQQSGRLTVDLTFQVPANTVEAVDRLEKLMFDADELCRREQLLTLPRSQLLVDFAQWYGEQFRRQIAGQPPTPWSGPLQP